MEDIQQSPFSANHENNPFRITGPGTYAHHALSVFKKKTRKILKTYLEEASVEFGL